MAVLVPAACVLWFMGEAMRNERLAVRQKLEEIYRTQLEGVDRTLGRALDARYASLVDARRVDGVGRAFQNAVAHGWADGLIVFDTSGQVEYPRPARSATLEGPERTVTLERAAALEVRRPRAALNTYAEIARQAPPRVAARAWQAQSRLLLRSGRQAEALEILLGPLASDELRQVVDDAGRSIAASAALLAARLLHESGDPRLTDRMNFLAHLVRDPDLPMPSNQRLFLMRQTQKLQPDVDFPFFEAEELSSRLVESLDGIDRSPGWQNASLDGYWQWSSDDGTILVVLDRTTLRSAVHELLPSDDFSPDAQLAVLAPSEPLRRLGDGEWSVEVPLRSVGDGWRMSLQLNDASLLEDAAASRATFLRWMAFLGIALIFVLALWIGRRIRGQVELARLKNDLLSTVSHELKTPLASMRLLVDTLLDEETADSDPEQQRDYLQMIASENARLSRLVENFLTFSRLERGRFVLTPRQTELREVVDAAVEALGEKLQADACHLEIDIAADVPPVAADPDALIMVVINLLDNAYKYSPEAKHIRLTAARVGDEVELAVEDHGIGIEPKVVGRLFERFYQADQRLARRGEGVGLGLAIVRRIVEAHGGRIDVASRLGEGSTFTVRLTGLIWG